MASAFYFSALPSLACPIGCSPLVAVVLTAEEGDFLQVSYHQSGLNLLGSCLISITFLRVFKLLPEHIFL